ncbi:MAG: two-component system sensor histidine kinase NtrB [Opitutaceae bacterium]
MAVLTAMLLVMFGAIAWMAHRTWLQSANVRTRFQSVHRVSAWLGHEFSDAVHQLDTRMLRFKLGTNSLEWERFQTDLVELRQWLADQRDYLASPSEILLLERIDREFAGYAAAAMAFANAGDPFPVSDAVEAQVTELSHRSKTLVELGMDLANAHQATVDELLEKTGRESAQLQWSTYAALGLMLCAGTGMGWLVYRDSIAPLRRSLTESRHQLAQQEKLAALGELAAGIAHEIRNPLTAIKARLFTLRKSPALDTHAAEDAGMINNEIDRLERIVRDFLRFARPPVPTRETVDVAALLRELRELVQPQFANSGVVVQVDDTSVPAVAADRDQLKQVLLNLAQNAADAILETGRPGTIRLGARSAEDPRRLRGKAGVRIEVRDDGPGIAPEVRARLFDPFFTTKASGTGLGLAISARLIEMHGGRIDCRSTPGRGTTFAIHLPSA